MGEAKRRKHQQDESLAVIPEPVRRQVAIILHKAIGALTTGYGADCLLYAEVGAEVLRRLGVEAKAVAGAASWRVGPQDGDVITHAPDHAKLVGTLAVRSDFKEGGQAGMFHAWIEAGRDVVDFSVVTLGLKAQMLDSLDGGKTQVDWCPEYLWKGAASVRTAHEVAQAPDGGVYFYRRDGGIEALVLPGVHREDVTYIADLVMTTLQSGADVDGLKVVGMGTGIPQDVASAKFRSQAIGLVEVELRPDAGEYPRDRG